MTASLRSFVLALLVLVVTSACGKSPVDPTPPPNGTANLTIKLTTSPIFGVSGLEGLDVAITGPNSMSQKADGSGNSTFSNLAYGSYTVTASGFGFVTQTQSAEVGQPAVTLSVSMPRKDEIKITNINPPTGTSAGGTIKCGSTLHVTVMYSVSQAYPTEPDGPLYVDVGLSLDGVQSSGSGSFISVSNFYGTLTLPVRVSNCSSPFTTNYILGQLRRIRGSNTVYASDAMPYQLNWQP